MRAVLYDALNYKSEITYGSNPIAYFSGATNLARADGYIFPDIWGSQYQYNTAFKNANFLYVDKYGYVYGYGAGANDSSVTNGHINYHFAYSVKGTLTCSENSDGTFTLQI